MRTKLVGILVAVFVGSVSAASSLSELEKPLRRHSTLVAFLNDLPALLRYKKALEGYYGTQTFSCERFEITVERLRALVGKIPKLAERLWEPVSSPEVGPFQESAGGKKTRAEFRFLPVPRRLHALWADAASGCGAESCALTESLGDRRWRVAREGTSTFVLEKDRRFTGGFVNVVPLTASSSSPRFLVLRGGARVLDERRSFANVITGRAVKSSAFHAWLDYFGAGTPSAQAVFATLGEEKSGGVPGAVARAYPGDENLGALGTVLPADPVLAEAAKDVPKRCDATLPIVVAPLPSIKSAGLTPGTPGSISTTTTTFEGPPAKVTNEAFALLGTPSGPAQIQQLPPEAKKRLADALPETLNRDPKPENRARAAALMNLLGTPGFVNVPTLPGLKPPPMPPPLIEYKDKFAESFAKGLADKVPEIRGMSAVGLDGSGHSGDAAAVAAAPRIARDLGAAVPLADGVFGGGTRPSSGTDRARRDLEDRAIRSMLDRGIPVPKDKVNRLMDNALSENDPERRKRKIDDIADMYFRNRDIGATIDTLNDANRWPPDFVDDVLAEIDRRPPDVCKVVKEMEKEGKS